MQIGELAKRADVSITAIRFYERKGLLPEPKRRESGYRAYTLQDVHRLRFIQQAKTLCFSLDEIREILQMRGRGKSPCVDVTLMAGQHLADLETRIRELEQFRAELSRALALWKASPEEKPSPDAFCILIERTIPHSTATRMEETSEAGSI